MNNRLIKSNDAGGGGACTNTVDLYNPFPDGGGVALYQLNGDATDVSGNYDGTASNVTYGAGEFGQAGVFNGSSSYVSGLPTLTNVSSEFSVSLWLKYTTNPLSGSKYVFGGIKEQGAEDSLVGIVVNDSGNIGYFTRGSNSGTVHQIISSADFTNGWHNVVIISDSTNMSLYVDGNNINTLSVSPTITVDNSVLGAINSRGTIEEHFPCSIDQVRIFSRALRPYEVEALYTEEYCTPTIVPSEHFNTVTYTGNGTNDNSISSGFTPDFVWIKARAVTDSHYAIDSVRTAGCFLYPNLTNAEDCNALHAAIETGGFNAKGNPNASGRDYVAWNFKAGGAAVTNTDGTITSQVSANTEAGFSVVSYTGNGTQPSTIGHGLGSAPKIVMNKCRSLGSTNWHVYSSDLGATSALVLNDTAAAYTGVGEWGSDPSSSVLYVNNTNTNFSGRTYVSYCFAEVEGFSNFGSYVGNGTSKTIVTGFEPAFVMFKVTSEADHWLMFDNKRGVVTDETGTYLIANLSQAEGSILPSNIKFLANGFEITGSGTYWNKANASYIYMAFAADPTTIEPSLEDSFNTVLYSGNGSATQQVTGVGFQPDFTWIKDRINSGTSHFLQDSVRGFSGASPNWAYSLLSDETISESTTGQSWRDNQGGVSSFDSDGFSVWTGASPSNSAFNKPAANYVAWNWKGAELPAINSNGSIPSVVSANPAAGFSIVSYTGSGANATIGHGLGTSPSMIIVKNRDNGAQLWSVYHASTGAGQVAHLNTTAAFSASGDWQSTTPDSNVYYTNNSPRTNELNKKMIAYCFAEVAGFSKFGSYSGTGVSGKSVTTDFEPAFILVKRTDNISAWRMIDNKRFSGGNKSSLGAQDSSAEQVGYIDIDFNSTNFTINSTNVDFNASGGTYVFMAFANQF